MQSGDVLHLTGDLKETALLEIYLHKHSLYKLLQGICYKFYAVWNTDSHNTRQYAHSSVYDALPCVYIRGCL
jgi:hypothetical protein